MSTIRQMWIDAREAFPYAWRGWLFQTVAYAAWVLAVVVFLIWLYGDSK